MANKRSTIYMTVTPDEYELPIYIADSIEELAERYNVQKGSIYTSISMNTDTGEKRGYKFAKVKVTDE